jgi:uncharacterized protein (TIGR02001 family)
MTPKTLALSLSLVLSASPLGALAQDAPADTRNPAPVGGAVIAPAAGPGTADEAPALTWNLALTSDYVFRGISQTDFGPAAQGGLDYSFGHGSGLYVGAWASGVDYGDADGPDVELDTYAGWSHDVSDAWNLDLSLVHYAYLGSSDAYGNVDYLEAIGKTTWNDAITLMVGYAPDYANLGASTWYFNLGGSWDVGHDVALNAGIGHTKFSDGLGSYDDWNLGLSRQFGPVNAAINYYDTSGDTGYAGKASDRLVLTLAFGNG